MNQTWFQEHLKQIAVSAVLFGGIWYLIRKDDQYQSRRPSLVGDGRIRTKVLADSRDPLGLKFLASDKRKVEKLSTPNSRASIFSSSSRSSVRDPMSKLRTSTTNGIVTRPEKGLPSSDLLKYPPIYYTLSNKAKWKFRKQLVTRNLKIA